MKAAEANSLKVSPNEDPMTDVKTQGIVLSTQVYGDYDLIIHFLTQDHGKLSAFATSAKKSKKRFAGGLDLFSCLDLELNRPKAKSSDLWRLQSTRLIEPNYHLRSNLASMANASYLSECLNKLLPVEESQDSVYHWWKQSLALFDDSKFRERKSNCLKLDFELLCKLGYQPHFSNCIHCMEELASGRVFFSFEKGGILCKGCFVAGKGTWVGSDSLKAFMGDGDEGVDNVRIMAALFHDFMSHTLSFRPKSQEFRCDVMGF